ncbi:MAG: IS1634 family transposase [Clostridiales bacterium]|nr:IS1634 family transposase [Clostridiales bacterium]
MSSISRQRVGKHTYLYESVSYRDEKGQPRNHRTPVGKIDPVTGEWVYKPEYIDLMATRGTPLNIPTVTQSFTLEQICKSTLKEYGSFYLYESLAKASGLMMVLQKIFPDKWPQIFTLASYLVSSGEPAMYLEDWLQKTESFPVGSMSSQRISELLLSISNDERMAFYREWGAYRCEHEYLALDITSVSSYSNLIEDVEWGYNRDGEDLPQVNLCMLLGEKSGLPVYQTIYSGSLKDVSTLKATLAQASGVSLNKLLLVMDKGFCSTININDMLEDSENIRFVIAAPFTLSFVKKQIQSEKKNIDCLQNTIVIGDDILRGVTKERSWGNKHIIFAHTFYNAVKAVKLRENLYAHVTLLKQEAEKEPKNPRYLVEFDRYLIIRKSEKNDLGYTVNIRQDVVEKELEHSGWLVLLSNNVSSPQEAISIYRTKDVVEKGFLRYKNCLDLGRLRIHSEKSMQNKVFVGFIGLILMAGIHKVMMDQGLYRSMTMKKMIKTLEKLRIQHINGNRILYPVTKEQNEIFKAFGLKEPV